MKKIIVAAILSVFAVACLQEKGGVAPATDTATNTDTGGTGTGGTGGTGTGGSTICDLVSGTNNATGEICFNTQILPIFISSCALSGCHDAKSKAEGYNLTSYDGIVKKGISKGNANKSEIYKVISTTGHDRMPPAPLAALSSDKIKLIADWINKGATNTTCQAVSGTLADTVKISYATHLKPILEYNCVGCHSSASASGNVKLDSYANVKVNADNGKLYGSIAQLSGYVAMPVGSKLSDCQIKAFKLWIDQGKLNN